MMRLNYFYDFISPFAYLMHEQLHRLPNDIQLHYVPVLFAGLLKHWGSLGPVEIVQKKRFTYRHTTWLANKLELPFRIPDTHPFNPLPYLRLSVAKDNEPELVTQLFRAIWTSEHNPATEYGRQAIWKTVSIPDATQLINAPEIKAALLANTQVAIEQGVFGVPTITVNDELFWGLDSFDMLIDYLDDPALFQADSMMRLNQIEYGVRRANY